MRPDAGRGREPDAGPRPLFVLAALALAAGAWACDSTEPAPRGAIEGMVLAEGDALPGITVELTGPTARAVTTDQLGRYTFADLPAGAYVVSLRDLPPDVTFPQVSRSAVVSGETPVPVHFDGNFIRTASIAGTVTSGSRGLEGVTVTLLGAASATTSTDAGGGFAFSALRAGAYEVEISGFPSSVSFTSVRTSVQLTTGQAHVVTFDGRSELTASAVIRTVLRRLPSGATQPADLSDLRGLIEVHVTLDRGEDTPDSLMVLLGDRVVGLQRFAVGGVSGEPAGAAEVSGPDLASPVDLVFPVNTAAFDSTTGVPRFFNGERNLQVRLATREGGPAAWTSTAPVVLRNPDTFFARLVPGAGPVTGQDGREWVGGDLEVQTFPVVYFEGRQVTAVTVALRRTQGAEIARRAVGATEAPIRAIFPSGPDAAETLYGYRTPANAFDEIRVVAAVYAGGDPVPGLPLTVLSGLVIDIEPPDGGSFVLPRQSGEHRCCVENWVGSDFLFAAAVTPGTDAGVGGVTVRVHVGPASASDEQVAAGPEVQRGSDLDGTTTNTAYRAVAAMSDALGNTRLVALVPSDGNPLGNVRGGVFGVDRSPPVAALDDGGAGLGPTAVNPPDGSAWLLQASGPPSGFGSQPVRATIRLRTTASPGAGICLMPGTAACDPAPDGFLRSVPSSGEGYYVYRARAIDRGGNLSNEVVARVLRDVTAPTLGPIQIPTGLEGGIERTFAAEATDNVDLHVGAILLRFGAAGAGEVWPFAAPTVLGTPFGGALTDRATITARFPFVHGLERATAGASGDAPDGVLHPARAARAEAHDAAGNRGQREAGLAGSDGFPVTGFGTADRGEDAAVRGWRTTASAGQVCREDAPDCGASAGTMVTLEAEARGRAGAFGQPFEAVHFILIEGERARWLGRATAAESAEVGTGDEGRRWRWRLDWTPAADIEAGPAGIVAIGVDAAGNALRSPTLDGLEVVGGG